MKRFTLTVLSVVVGVGGCAKRIVQLPPEAFVTLSGKKAPYRAWAQVEDLCAVDARLFTDEHQVMSALLADWLGQTSATVDGAWDDEHLALLEEGVRQLPAALALQQAALQKAGSCAFTGLGPASELNAQAQRRVQEAPDLVLQVRARLALAKWKEGRPAAQQAAKDETCSTKLKPPAPLLYFAAEDETARLEWLFCDGSKVVASPGNPPAWQPDPAAKKPKKDPDPKLWLDVAAKFPPESVSRAPKLPKKKVQRDDGAPEPEDKL
jgi:hypothetical protein